MALTSLTAYSNKQYLYATMTTINYTFIKIMQVRILTSCPPGLAETDIIGTPLNLVASNVRLILLDTYKVEVYNYTKIICHHLHTYICMVRIIKHLHFIA